jgi:hypothetical protein
VNLWVPITVDPVNAQFAQHLIVFQSFGLVETEHRDLLCEQFVEIGGRSQWLHEILLLVVPVIG